MIKIDNNVIYNYINCKCNMKKLFKILFVSTLILTGINTIPVNGNQGLITTVEAASVKLNAKSKTLYKGKTTTLKVKGTKKKVKWSSSNKKIATVSSKGKVTAKKVGKCTITAKVNGKKYKCKIIVKKAKSIKLNKTSIALDKGWVTALKVTGTTKKVTWKSSNKSIATVSSKGQIKAKKVGKCTITAKVSGKTLKCKLTVTKPTAINTTSITKSPVVSKEAFNLINKERAKVGLPAYKWSDELASLAKTRAKECLQQYSHIRPDGTILTGGRLENLGGKNTASAQIDSWMHSTGHKKNILRKEASECAVAKIYCPEGNQGYSAGYYWVAVFYSK